jgi:hypothetical protein
VTAGFPGNDPVMQRPEDHNEADPRDDDPRAAQDVDPKTGMSDDPRVVPKPEGAPATP